MAKMVYRRETRGKVVSPYPEGMHFYLRLLLEHSSSDAFHCPDLGHRESRETLLDPFRGMPVASICDQPENIFHFEEHMESTCTGIAIQVGTKI